jgi:hypothetical protein
MSFQHNIGHCNGQLAVIWDLKRPCSSLFSLQVPSHSEAAPPNSPTAITMNRSAHNTIHKPTDDFDFFSSFRALNQAACGIKGTRCNIYTIVCILAALFLFTVIAFFVGVGIYSCRSSSRQRKREEKSSCGDGVESWNKRESEHGGGGLKGFFQSK